jgi:cellulose synthase/poly-beta-1,6-N-acetylglucosamine synthase-like glycosyltransferase
VLSDWIHWLSSLSRDEICLFLLGLLLTDVPRYAVGKLVLCLADAINRLWSWTRGKDAVGPYAYAPTVTVLVAGYNEADTIEATLKSLWGSYPGLEIIVVDDGSEDGMFAVSRRFAQNHAGVTVIARGERGGKSSALNFGLRYAKSEVIVLVDADSHLGPNAIWELVQPLANPKVGAVAGAVLARNPFASLWTWLQAYEYLSTIFIGRMLSARLGILAIVSGAMGAFRRSALERVKGWDVGPPEDLDLTLTLRKAGYQIAFAPYAQCFTELPATLWGLVKQRLR